MSKKSTAPKSKPRDKSAPMAGKTIDDVYYLLDQINKVTLRRMETENEETLKRIENQVNDIQKRVKFIDDIKLNQMDNNVNAVMQVISNTLHPNIMAIKTKVGA